MTHGVQGDSTPQTIFGAEQTRSSWVDDFLRPQARVAKSENQLLWLCFAPSFEPEAQAWITRLNESTAPVLQNFRRQTIDSVHWPELDQAAQTLMQSLTGRKGWPVNLIIEPDTLKPIIGFAALEETGMATLLDQLFNAWEQDSKRLIQFAEMSFFKASSQDPLRFAADPGQCFRSLHEAVTFFSSPLSQSFSSQTGSFGTGEGHLLYPAAYTCLSHLPISQEGPDLGEASLATLIRSPAFDPVAPSFYRVTPIDAATPDSTAAVHVKSLRENSEMLDTLVSLWLKTRSPLLFETAVALLGTLLGDFLVKEGMPRLSAWISSPFSSLAMSKADLLTLAPRVRLAAQEFFDLRSEPRLPRLAKSVDEVAKAQGLAPQETLLGLQEARKELAAFRGRRMANWGRGPVDANSEMRALESMCRALRVFESPHLLKHAWSSLRPLIERIAMQYAGSLRARDGVALAGCRLQVYLLFRTPLAQLDGLEELTHHFGDGESIRQELLALQFMDLTVDSGFLGTRYDLVDHLGSSGVADQLRVLARAVRESGALFHGLFEKGETFIFEEMLLNLSRVKRLGLVSASLFSGALEFFEGRAEQLEVGRLSAAPI